MEDDANVMSYEQQMREAQKSGDVEQLTYEFYNWEHEDQVLIGQLLKVEELPSDTYESNFFRYIFDTDKGEVAVICGAVADKVLSDGSLIGSIIAITYKGKMESKSGQKFNMFTVEVMTKK